MARHFLAALSALLMAGPCTPVEAQPAPPKGQRAPAEQRSVTDRLADLEQQLATLRSRVNTLSRRIGYDLASLDCNSKKYVEFRFEDSHLIFFASCKAIEPYLEGHKVQISIGNPHSFNFSNVKGNLGYGKTIVGAADQKVEISLTESIRAGSWHTITVIVNPSKAEDMRELILELKAETAWAPR